MDEWIAGFARQGWHDQLAVLLQVAYAMLLGGAAAGLWRAAG